VVEGKYPGRPWWAERPERGSVPVGNDGVLDCWLIDDDLYRHVFFRAILVHALTGDLPARRWRTLSAALLLFAVQDTRFAHPLIALCCLRRWAFCDGEALNAPGRIDGNLASRSKRGSKRDEGEDEQSLTNGTEQEVAPLQLTLS